MPAPLHPLARRPVAEFLRLADARLPGVVQGLYLVGSIALDDFHTGVSDVDFLAVTAEPLDDAALDRLERLNRTGGSVTSGSNSQARQAAAGTSAAPVQIRAARPADAPALGRLLTELGYPQAEAELGPRIAILADGDTDAVLVAEVGGQVVGMASLHVTPFFNEGRSRGRI